MTITRPLTSPIARPLGVPSAGSSAAPHTYATWNQDDKDASVVLSNGDLTASKPAGAGWGNVRATIGVADEKWRWLKTDGTGAHLIVGVGTAGAALDNYLGSDENGWGFYSGDGVFYHTHNGSVVAVAYLAQGATVEMRLDLEANTFSAYVGNSLLHSFDISSRGSATLYPMQSMFGAGAAATANFGPDNLGPAITGYNDGVYE